MNVFAQNGQKVSVFNRTAPNGIWSSRRLAIRYNAIGNKNRRAAENHIASSNTRTRCKCQIRPALWRQLMSLLPHSCESPVNNSIIQSQNVQANFVLFSHTHTHTHALIHTCRQQQQQIHQLNQQHIQNHIQQQQTLHHQQQQQHLSTSNLDQTLVDKWNMLLLCYHPFSAHQKHTPNSPAYRLSQNMPQQRHPRNQSFYLLNNRNTFSN